MSTSENAGAGSEFTPRVKTVEERLDSIEKDYIQNRYHRFGDKITLEVTDFLLLMDLSKAYMETKSRAEDNPV